MFDEFYKLYPRHDARKDALKAWGQHVTSPELVEIVMAGLRAQLPKMKRNDKKYIPLPATWLRGHRWEDDMDTPALNARNLNVCHSCGGAGTVLVGPPVLEIRHCSCQPYAGETIAAIHPDDWQAYSKVLAACAGQGRSQ